MVRKPVLMLVMAVLSLLIVGACATGASASRSAPHMTRGQRRKHNVIWPE